MARRYHELHDKAFLEARLHSTRQAIADEIGCSVPAVALALRGFGLRMKEPMPLVEPGQRYGRLIVVGDSGQKRRGEINWTCVCDCGCQVLAFTGQLRGGKKKSCGCLRSELATEKVVAMHTTHGLRSHPLYTTWIQMRQRCYNPNSISFERYGGKGVTVCDRWQGPDGFPNFLADLGEKPGPEYTLDRIDPDGNYEPGNCRWADPVTQTMNTRARKAAGR